MLLTHLFEKPRTLLPFKKDSMANSRGRHDALIAVMHPVDFLKLTTNDQAHLDSIIDTVDRTVDQYNSGESEYNKFEYNIPYLLVSYPSGKVMGHEGRHRAAMVLKSGGISFPVAIALRSPIKHFVTWEQMDDNGDVIVDADDEPVVHSKEFDKLEDAEKFKNELKSDWGNGSISVKKVTIGGNILKGHPDRNNFNVHPWVYGKWTPEDMPPVLIGEENDSIRIPTNRMKVGVIKK